MAAGSRAHCDRLCPPVHRSGRMCTGSGGSRSRPSNMDSRVPKFISGAPRLASSSLSHSLEWLGLSPVLWGASFLGEYRRDSRHFLNCLECLGNGPAPGFTEKRLCVTLVRSMRRATNNNLVTAGPKDQSIVCPLLIQSTLTSPAPTFSAKFNARLWSRSFGRS